MFLFWLLLCLFSFGLMVQLSMAASLEEIADAEPFEREPFHATDRTSVVVVFKDEEDTLPGLIEDLKVQQGQTLRFMLVDDHSTDQSAALVHAATAEDVRFEYRSLPNHVQGKKAALRHVLLELNSDHVILTDADCRISDSTYCQKLSDALRSGSDMIVGSGLVHPGRHWLTRAYAQLVLSQHVLFHAAIAWGIPFMAVGRSMAFRLECFKASGAMEAHIDHPSGTDDLLLQDFVRSDMRITSLPEAVTLAHAPRSISEWVQQRSRHLSVGDRYPWKALLLVWSVEALNLLVPFFVLLLLWFERGSWMLVPGTILLLLFIKLIDIISVQFLDAAHVRSRGQHLPWLGIAVSSVNALISATAAVQMPRRWKRT